MYNARGCGFTDVNTPQLFNASITDDIREALRHIQKQVGERTPLIGIGFSLGSNILVKVRKIQFFVFIVYYNFIK